MERGAITSLSTARYSGLFARPDASEAAPRAIALILLINWALCTIIVEPAAGGNRGRNDGN